MNSPFIVAEIGANHGGSYQAAEQLVYVARDAGADAVKFQTYTPEGIAADVPIFSGPWSGRSYHDLYREAMTPWEWHEPLFELARRLGLIPFSSPFSVEDVERLESIKCPIYKIASPEIVHHDLIAAAARTHKPMIISTGMAELHEIYDAADVAERNGCKDLTFLHCISAYPAKSENFNLATMVRLSHHNFKVGLSDHSRNVTAAAAAVALGATVIEKHLCLDHGADTPDSKFSLTGGGFAELVRVCRETHAALGEVRFGCRPSEEDSFQYRRSLWLVKDIKEGEIITPEHLAVLRPNYGAKPCQWGNIVWKRAVTDMTAGTPIVEGLVRHDRLP